MKADIDPELEAQVIRSLQVLRADTRVEPWSSPLARVETAVRHQNRVRVSAGVAGLAAVVVAAVVGVGVATSTGAGPRTIVPGSIATVTAAAPSTASALSFLPVRTAPPSYAPATQPGIKTAGPSPTTGAPPVPGDPPPETTPISGTALKRMKAIAAHLETVWGDLAPTRIEVVYAKDGRALSGTAGDPNAPIKPAYPLELQGHFSCRSCNSLRQVSAGVLFQAYDADFQLMEQTVGGNTWGDLNRFGKAVPLSPVDPTATPRPLGPTLARALQGKAPANLATAEHLALLEAVDPTTAKVAWSEELTYGQLRKQSPHEFVEQSRKPGPGDKLTAEQFAAAADNAKVMVVAVDGLILNEHENATTWAEMFWVTGPYAGGSSECGQDLCGLKAPTR